MASASLTPVHQPRELTLFCWILDISDRSFPVDIGDDRTVGHLKAEIVKKKPFSFENVDPDELDLWKTSIPIDRQLKIHISKQHFLENDVLLEGDPLEEIFPLPEPAKKTLHIVVRNPRSLSTGLDLLSTLRIGGQSFLTNILQHTPEKGKKDFEDSIQEFPDECRPGPPPRKKVRLIGPHTPSKIGAALPDTEESPPRLFRQHFNSSMTTALQPFAQYITNLANGKFDIYFNSTQTGPSASNQGPILLLHSLGNYPDDTRLTGLFKSDTVHLFAVSGSGKTRLSLEGLCHKWGLYISCGGDYRKRASGSSDFLYAIEQMESMSNWKRGTDDAKVDAAHRAFAMLICARVFVLKCLLENLPAGTTAKIARQRWVLVQVMPPSHVDDIFVTVLGSLCAADKTDMMDFTRNMIKDMAKLFGTDFFPVQGLFAVVDEAQVAAEYMEGSFRSTTETEKRPILHPFYRFLWYSKLFKGVILAGTGLSMKMVRTSVSSQSAQLLDFRREPFVFVEVGQFKKGGTDHKAYIEKFLHLSQSASDQRLMERILYWFHGRHRFTASLIEILLSAPPGSPHRILSAVVYSLTGFELTDAIDLEEGEPPVTTTTRDRIHHLGPIAGETFLADGTCNSASTLVDMKKCIFHAVMLWKIRSQSTSIPINANLHQTIAAGIGHLEKVGPDQTFDQGTDYPVYLCEPLVVLRLSSILSKYRDTMVKAWVADSARGFVLEEAILLVLLKMFGGKECALSDAFDTDQSWGSRKVTLVSLKRGSDGQMWSFPVSWGSGSSDRLGYKASSPEDVVKFLNNPDGMCFLFPDNYMGPDLSCFFQDVVTKELIFLCLQSKLLKNLSAKDALSALASVNPDFFYNCKKHGARVIYAPSKYPNLVDDVLGALVPKIGSAEYKPLVDGIRKKLRSSTNTDNKLVSQSQRSTPRYLRIIATRDDKWIKLFKADSKGEVGVLRWQCVEQHFGDVMWDSAPTVH